MAAAIPAVALPVNAFGANEAVGVGKRPVGEAAIPDCGNMTCGDFILSVAERMAEDHGVFLSDILKNIPESDTRLYASISI